jgi:hypothetical protein
MRRREIDTLNSSHRTLAAPTDNDRCLVEC